MTKTVQGFLCAFEALSPEEQQSLATEILRRCAPTEPLADAAFVELADELFQRYDADEEEPR
jgi:hypothetical protein